MKVTPQEVVGCELIGTTIKVVGSSNKSLLGISGKVVDETKNTIILEQDNKEKKLIKNQITIQLTYKNQKFQIDGRLIAVRPEDRLKIKLR